MRVPQLTWLDAAAGTALCAPVARWLLQGSHNVYTDLEKQLYVADPDLGWRLTQDGPIWLGLDAIALAAASVLAFVIGRRLLRGRGALAEMARKALWGAFALPLVMALAAFASGQRPAGARDTLPDSGGGAAAAGNFQGALPSPAGTYAVVEHTGSSVVASLVAGGEEFEARFAAAPTGHLRFDPGDLRQPIASTISFASASVDTGIDLRSKHAREELRVEEHPRIGFRLDSIDGVSQEDATSLSFVGKGQIELMGQEHLSEIRGVVKVVSPEGLQRLGFADGHVLVVQAQTELRFSEIAVENDGTFDSDQLPIHVSLVLRRQPTPKKDEER